MEKLIRRRLTANEQLTNLLGTFSNESAIFFQKAPADTDSPDNFFPQIIFTTDKYSDAQKGLAGQLTLDIITAQTLTPPEPIEKIVRQTLEGVFFKGEEIFSLKWKTTEIFTEPASEKMPLIFGATLTFDIYEYPSAETSTPDPIEALNFWAQCFDENLMIIGVSDFEEFFIPSRARPAIYFDVAKVKLAEQKTAAVFVDATINLHLFAPTLKAKREWLTALHEQLLLQGAVWLADDSPMRLLDSEYDWARSEAEGQIQMRFSYGILRKKPYAHTLINRNISFGKDLKWNG